MLACDLCGNKYPNLSKLNEHIKRAHKKPTIPCPDCKKKFGTRSQLREHSAVHGPGIKCGFCGTRMQNLSNLRRHLKKTCEGNLEQYPKTTSLGPAPALSTAASSAVSGDGKPPPKLLACEFCEAPYNERRRLNEHIKRNHKNLNVKCDDCGTVFSDQSRVTQHQKRVHGPKKPCPNYANCQYTSGDISNFNKHMRRCRAKFPDQKVWETDDGDDDGSHGTTNQNVNPTGKPSNDADELELKQEPTDQESPPPERSDSVESVFAEASVNEQSATEESLEEDTTDFSNGKSSTSDVLHDCDTPLLNNCCLICGSPSVDGSSDDNDDKIVETFLNCVDLTDNYNDVRERLDGIEFCLICKLRLEELDHIQSQIDRLSLRLRQLKMSVTAKAVQQSSVPSKNSSASGIRRFLRKKFMPQVLLEKCDSEKQQNTMKKRPTETSSVARKRPTSHSSSAPAEPMLFEQPEEIRSTVVDFDAASLLDIKFEEFNPEGIEDYEMKDPSEVYGTEITQDDHLLIQKNDGGSDNETDGTAGSTLKETTHSGTNFLTVTPMYKLLPSSVDSQIAANHYPAFLAGNDPSYVGSLPSEPCPWTSQDDSEHHAEKYIFLHCEGPRLGEPTNTTKRKNNRVERVRTVQSLWPATNTVASGPVTLREEVRHETAKGHIGSYKYKGVQVTVINHEHLQCGAKCCSKVFTGKWASNNVSKHIQSRHLRKRMKRFKTDD